MLFCKKKKNIHHPSTRDYKWYHICLIIIYFYEFFYAKFYYRLKGDEWFGKDFASNVSLWTKNVFLMTLLYKTAYIKF